MSPRDRPGPVEVLLVDLDRPGEAVASQVRHEHAWLVGFRGGVPLGIVDVDRRVPGALEVGVQELSDRVPDRQPARPVEDGELPSISVVVPSIVARTEELAACLASLSADEYPDVEILVVDNRRAVPAADPLPQIAGRWPSVRTVRATQPGISAARTAGVTAARGEVVVFTDDDVRVHPGWLRALGSRFARDRSLVAVTGLILPAELETPAQVYFERYYGGFSGVRTFAPLTLEQGGTGRLRDRAQIVVRDEAGLEQRRFGVYGVGAYGAGANMAFRREHLLGLGAFDLALGTGTPTRGGEDLAALITVLWHGGRVGYEPSAVVFHQHRRTEEELVHQLVGNGRGFTAMLTALVLVDPRHLLAIAGQLPLALPRILSQSVDRLRGRPADRADPPSGVARRAPHAYPRHLVLHELRGMPGGPVSYLRSRRAARRWVAPPPRTADPALR